MKKAFVWTPVALAILIAGGAAFGGSIKTWISGESLKASDLNTALSHIHSTMVGGHGARLMDADVYASANISHTKLKNSALLPKAIGGVTDCDGTVASMTVCPTYKFTDTNITGIYSSAAAGRFWVSLDSVPPDTEFTAFAACHSYNVTPCWCAVTQFTTAAPQLLVYCNNSAGAMNPASFSITVYDDDNWN